MPWLVAYVAQAAHTNEQESMTMVLMISYDLNGQERPSSYVKVKELVQKKATSSIKPLYSQWFVETTDSADNWSDYLIKSGAIDKSDRLFITGVQSPYQGWLTKEHWDWLNSRV